MDNELVSKLILELKAAARTIYDNADKIIGGYKWQTDDLDITITINDSDAPRIVVRQELYSDNTEDLYK